ncbi:MULTISPECIES: hypothetical protein [unclassified Sphingomonas]|jgi:hypothetical protein|uniref:hypothetical protein n=1 Tax=unclassified Sphingomonas TaxID=196159 RepID=UPI00226994BC|nr:MULTISPECIES: hypothetical protein [unclassified Sphingomonas]
MDDSATNNDKPLHPVWGKVGLLAFGLCILAFLTAIDRPEWFHLRPASGTAAALTLAAERP